MQFQDLNDYLHNDILTKVDRASMYCSQEVRVPYLNINVVKAAWSIPKDVKKNKLILKNILEKYIPRELLNAQRWVLNPFRNLVNWLFKGLDAFYTRKKK